MTTYAYDTEFLEDGRNIHLISIGIVASDGREYYAVDADLPAGRIVQNQWLLENVWPHLPLDGYTFSDLTRDGETQRIVHDPGVIDRTSEFVKPRWVIRNEVRAFLTKDVSEDNPASLWADYGAYDHVVLAQLFGMMIDLPEGIPMFTNDLQTALQNVVIDEETGKAIAVRVGDEHSAIDDARSVMQTLKLLRIVDDPDVSYV